MGGGDSGAAPTLCLTIPRQEESHQRNEMRRVLKEGHRQVKRQVTAMAEGPSRAVLASGKIIQ